MMRTSLYISKTLHQRLLILSKKKDNHSLSKTISDLLNKALVTEEQERIEAIYQAMDKIKGIGNPDIQDGSTTINKTLYGKKGAWRGSEQ